VSSLRAGQRLHERFVLVERIGEGGMSQVWRATDEVLARPVAVKTLSAGIATDPALQEATWREARAAARLTHPNITRIYDYGQAPLPDGSLVPYLVMELVEGHDLASRFAAGPLAGPEVARIGSQIAAALAAAHRLGVVHHDIKPGNVMLTPDGVKVLDFGIAALTGAAAHDRLVGTPTYAAPERLRHSPARPASDVYSLGVLLHEALTGRPPATLASWADAAAVHGDGGPRAELPESLAPGMAALVLACLSPDPLERPPADQVAAALAAVAGRPDPTPTLAAGPPAAATVPHYTVGAAALPAPHTQVDSRTVMAPAPARGRLTLAGIAVAAVLLGLTTALAVAALRPTASGVPDGSAATGTPAPSATPSAPPSRTPDPTAATAMSAQVLGEIELAITRAREADRLDRADAADLLDRLDEARREVLKPGARNRDAKVRDKLEDLLEDIDDLLDDGDVTAGTAAGLRDPVVRALQLVRG
jgi:serine/threonine-protein kinase